MSSTKSITLTKSKAPAARSGQPAPQRVAQFVSSTGTRRPVRQPSPEPEYEEEVEEERSPSREPSEEEPEYEEERSPPRRSPSPKRKKARSPPPAASKSSSKSTEIGLGRQFSSLLLQNIPKNIEATDLFLNVFDASDDAAEIEMHTHEDGSSTGTAQMYFEREGAAEAAARKYNGKTVEGRPLRMIVIKSKLANPKPAATTPPKRKREASASPPRKPVVPERKPVVREVAVEKPKPVAKPVPKPVEKPVAKPAPKEVKEPPIVKPKAPVRSTWQPETASGFAEYAEEDYSKRTEVVRPKITTKPREAVQVVVQQRDRPQVVLAKNKDKFAR